MEDSSCNSSLPHIMRYLWLLIVLSLKNASGHFWLEITKREVYDQWPDILRRILLFSMRLHLLDRLWDETTAVPVSPTATNRDFPTFPKILHSSKADHTHKRQISHKIHTHTHKIQYYTSKLDLVARGLDVMSVWRWQPLALVHLSLE